LDVIFIRIFRKITAAILIIAVTVCCGFFNIMGGYALIVNNYETAGAFLIVSSAILIPVALLTITSKTTILPCLFNIVGTACYLYTINALNNIPNAAMTMGTTQTLLNNHLSTFSVTILIFLLAFINYMSVEKVNERNARKEFKAENKKTDLSESEKIV
jgi:ABC-type transport system involved in cytochrome c biogenesis permease subunit